jgi:hypothetical protein
MSKDKTPRIHVGSLKDLTVYPRPNTKRTMEELKTVGITLTANEAVELADYLLQGVVQGAEKVDLTGYREENRVTVTFK